MQQSEDGVALETPSPVAPQRPQLSRWVLAVGVVCAAAVIGSVLLLWGTGDSGGTAAPTPDATSPASPSATASSDPTAERSVAVTRLLMARGRAVLEHDRAAFLATIDPSATDFYAAQTRMFDRLDAVPVAEWSYQETGEGPGLVAERATALPDGSAIVRVRLTYRLTGTRTDTDREQYLTVVPRGEGWLVASDTDADASDMSTQRDLWDLGPVRVQRGDTSLVVADARGPDRQALEHLADEADLAVHDVDEIWTGAWSHHPVLIFPRNQHDMAMLIGSDGEGLAQIAAVTTGAFESGLSRGDRIVINPAAWETLGSLGRRVVITHEMTHIATRASGVQPLPIWLSEGFADYVAYRAVPVPTSIVAGDVLDDVRDGKGPRRLPEDEDFDASQGDVAASYEGAWLAARLIADRYGQRRLVRLVVELADSDGPGWPQETSDVLGIGRPQLVGDWKAYLRSLAAA